MSFRSTALLFGLSLGMLWLFGLMLAYKKTAFEESAIIPSLAAATDAAMDSVTIQRKDKGKENQEFQFTQAKDVWTLKTSKNAIRVDNFRIEQMIREIKNARRNEETRVGNDPALYDLESPQLVVTLRGKVGLKKDQEKEWTLKIGKESADQTQVYVLSSDRPNRIFAVAKNSIDSLFFKDASALRSRQLFDFSDVAVKKIILKEPKNTLEIQKNEDESWRFVQPPLGFADYEGPPPPKDLPPGAKTDNAGVKGLIANIRGLRVDSEDDFVPPTETSLAEFGLEEGKESLRVQVVAGDEKKDDILLIGNKVTGRDQFFARLVHDQGIFKLGTRPLQPLREAVARPGQLRSMDLLPLDTKKIDQVKIVADKEEIKLTHSEDKPWQVQVGSDKAAQADEKTVQNLLDALQGKREIQKFFEDFPETEAKKLEADLTSGGTEVVLFTVSQDKKDAKKKDDKEAGKEEKKEEKKPAVMLTFGKADKDQVPVRRVLQDGTTSRFTLNKGLVEKIVPDNLRLAFLDTALPGFTADDVTSLTLERGKEKLEIHRGSGAFANRWIFPESPGSANSEKNFADPAKVQTIIKDLGSLHAKKWLQKIDPKTDLEKFRLKDPAVTINLVIYKSRVSPQAVASCLGLAAISTDQGALLAETSLLGHREKNKETLTVRFGKETDQDKDKPGIFAQHSGSDLLFLVDPGLVKTLKDIDLRDRSMILAMQPILDAGAIALGPQDLVTTVPLLARTVQNFDAGKIKEVKLEMRTSTELRKFHFIRENKDKTWQDQSSLLEFALDPEKVNSLVEQYARLQADRLVSLAGGSRAEYRFGPGEATLKVDLVMENGPTITLTVGASFQGTGYFAQTSSWPGLVFLLPPGRVDPILRGTGYFGKERIAANP